MIRRPASIIGAAAICAAMVLGAWAQHGCGGCSGEGGQVGDGTVIAPPCPNGVDKDGDKYGESCPGGADCDDSNSMIHPNAPEVCDGKDNNCNGLIDDNVASNPCGSCDPGCWQGGAGSPFPVDPSKDPNVKDANGVKLDPNGDLVLDNSNVSFNYLWIANTYDIAGTTACSGDPPPLDRCRGSVSKVDTVKMQEVARYYTVTCTTKTGATGCADVNGLPITLNHRHTPSRTAVDFNFDVWVANRSVHGGQASATKIANDPGDCKDRNGNGQIDTSNDQDGDGKINADCNGDGLADSASTACTNGKPPEFLGDDDECILFTTNYGDPGDVGRSICLDSAKANVGASNAWVGSFFRPENNRGPNRFYGINGYTGKIETIVNLPDGHHSYGCMADAHHIVWSTDIGYKAGMLSGAGSNGWPGSLAYLSTLNPNPVGPLLRGPSATNYWKDQNGEYHHYGIGINADQHVWLGGIWSPWVLRYKPNRTSFETLSQGTWTRIDLPPSFATRGIAADNRGKVWSSINDGGYMLRLDQSLPDGVIDKTGAKEGVDYWPLTANTVIGAGVDFNGNIWGIGQANNTASRLDVDKSGNVVQPPTGKTKAVTVGQAPYTYSDFTGFGLMNFVRQSGRYVYQVKACPDGVKATWTGVKWNATTPTGTAVFLRVRSGDSDTTFGSWSSEFNTSPAMFGPKSATPIKPNPSTFLQVEFTLKNTTKQSTPILHDYGVSYFCGNVPG